MLGRSGSEAGPGSSSCAACSTCRSHRITQVLHDAGILSIIHALLQHGGLQHDDGCMRQHKWVCMLDLVASNAGPATSNRGCGRWPRLLQKTSFAPRSRPLTTPRRASASRPKYRQEKNLSLQGRGTKKSGVIALPVWLAKLWQPGGCAHACPSQQATAPAAAVLLTRGPRSDPPPVPQAQR